MKSFQEWLQDNKADEGVLNSIKSTWKLLRGKYNKNDYDRALQAAQAVVNSPDALSFGTTAWKTLQHLGLLTALGLGGHTAPHNDGPQMVAAQDDVDVNPTNVKPKTPEYEMAFRTDNMNRILNKKS